MASGFVCSGSCWTMGRPRSRDLARFCLRPASSTTQVDRNSRSLTLSGMDAHVVIDFQGESAGTDERNRRAGHFQLDELVFGENQRSDAVEQAPKPMVEAGIVG